MVVDISYIPTYQWTSMCEIGVHSGPYLVHISPALAEMPVTPARAANISLRR